MDGILYELATTEIGTDMAKRYRTMAKKNGTMAKENGTTTRLPTTKVGMGQLRKDGITRITPMKEMDTDQPETMIIGDSPANCRENLREGLLLLDSTTLPPDGQADGEAGVDSPGNPRDGEVVHRTAAQETHRSLDRCVRSHVPSNSDRGQRASRDVSRQAAGHVKPVSSLPSDGEKPLTEKQTRHLSQQEGTTRFRFKIKDGQFYHQTDGQSPTGTSLPKGNIKLSVHMTTRGTAPLTLDPSGPDSEGWDIPVNQSPKTKAPKTQDVRGQRQKGPRARKGPRPGSSLGRVQPHLYTRRTEAQTEAEDKQQGKRLRRQGQPTNPGRALTTRTKAPSEPSQLSPQQERDNRFKWSVACFMVNATALLVKLGDLVESYQYPLEGPNPT